MQADETGTQSEKIPWKVQPLKKIQGEIVTKSDVHMTQLHWELSTYLPLLAHEPNILACLWNKKTTSIKSEHEFN